VAIIERDSSVRANPDLTFAAADATVPVVGLIMIGRHKSLKTQRHDLAEEAFAQITQARGIAVMNIDTALDRNFTGCARLSRWSRPSRRWMRFSPPGCTARF